ncbi:MAG: hypothetical protein WCI18_06100 [Pseudomonadota bacterium]
MKEKIQIKHLAFPLSLILSTASCKTPMRSGEAHRPFVLQPKNMSTFNDLQPSALCEDDMGPVLNQATISDKNVVIQTQRPMLANGFCKILIFGKPDPELKFLSAKKSGQLPLYYESRHIKMQPDPMSIEMWKLIEGKGRAPARILVSLSELNGLPTEARLKCNEFATFVPKTRAQASLVEFEVEASNLGSTTSALTNCTVTGNVGQSAFATQVLPTFNFSWGGQSMVSAVLKKDALPLEGTKHLGVSPETLRNALPGIWTFRNQDGSCLNLEFKAAASNLAYRYFRGEPTSCRQIPTDLPFKDAILLSREDEIPTALRSKIGANSFLIQFKRTGEESSWSLMTLGSNKLLKLGNNILNPAELLSIAEGDTYQKN